MASRRSCQGLRFLALSILPLSLVQLATSADLSGSADQEEHLCRAREDYLPPRLFAKHACALCYKHHPAFQDRQREWDLVWSPATIGNKTYGYLVLSNGTTKVEADYLRPDPGLVASFPAAQDVEKWLDCCQSAVVCCRRMIDAASAAVTWCPPTWDGWQCWEAAPPDTTSSAVCPSYIYATKTPHCDHYATKQCNADGTWWRTPPDKYNRTREYSDYVSCVETPDMLRRVYVHVSANAVSIIMLVPALIIFFSYRQLNVHRVSIHKNFFMSLLLNSVMVIVFKCVVILNELNGPAKIPSIAEQNGVGCKILFIVTKYCRLTNYLWQFCESFYLHKLIASAFAEQKSLLVFYLIGWVFPLVPVTVYAALRARFADERCWVLPVDAFEWVLNAPCLLSLVICTVFLINIIRVLVTKLRAQHTNEPSQYRRAVRATLVLVPLFGLHLVVTIYRPSGGGCIWMEMYYYGDYLLDGLQGAMVALIFCYLNGEVQNLLRRTYGHHLNLRSPSFRTGHRSSSLSGRSQNTMHTMVGLENTTSAALDHPDCQGGPLLLHGPPPAAEKEARL